LSVKFEDGGTRIKTLIDTLRTVSSVYSLATKGKGISTEQFLNARKSHLNVGPGKMAGLMDQVVFEGVTPIGTKLRDKVLAKHVTKDMKRPLLVIVITDGEMRRRTLLVAH
jgi:hypothetical protein